MFAGNIGYSSIEQIMCADEKLQYRRFYFHGRLYETPALEADEAAEKSDCVYTIPVAIP
jgi:hypothetical protein